MQNQLRSNEKKNITTQPRHGGHHFLNNFFNMFELPSTIEFQNMEPKIEVSENKKNIMVTAELPGVNEQDIDLEISTNGYLTISGEKRHENTEVSKGGYFSEISYGHVSRTIPLPWDLDYPKASAKFDNGVLSISIPKTNTEQENKRKIAINKTTKKTKKSIKKKA